ncbi:amidohydrolase family protein [Candidatus Dependentiae bacterium]|nr:amidohydrolase family protein [Candidatus Dependentiae bacterium]
MYDNYKIIDTHTHIFPDELAERAITFLEEEGNIKAEHNGTVLGLLKNMEQSGIDRAVVLSIATKPGQVDKINQWAAAETKKFFPKLLLSGTLHPDYENIEDSIKFLKKNNINVIKLHPEYQYFCPADKRVFKLYEIASDYEMAIYFHAGRDIAYVGSRCTPKILNKIINKYPKLKVVAAHLGSFELWDEVLTYLAGENIFLDTGFTFDHISEDIFYKIFEKHDKSKILFGTDSPWKPQLTYVKKILNLRINREFLKKMLWDNAESLFWNNDGNYV